jgi:hypothetical protein
MREQEGKDAESHAHSLPSPIHKPAHKRRKVDTASDAFGKECEVEAGAVCIVSLPGVGLEGDGGREDGSAPTLSSSPAILSPASAIFGSSKIITTDLSEISKETLGGKVLGLYFSAKWCSPCRAFTPLLTRKYKGLISEGKSFEVVYISRDSG